MFSNSIDNMPTPKKLAIGLQITLAIVWFGLGIQVTYFIDAREAGKDPTDQAYLLHPLENLSQIVAAGILIINILQVYNWFNQKYISTMVGFYFLA